MNWTWKSNARRTWFISALFISVLLVQWYLRSWSPWPIISFSIWKKSHFTCHFQPCESYKGVSKLTLKILKCNHFIFSKIANRLENAVELLDLLGCRIGDGHFDPLVHGTMHLLFDWHELAVHFISSRYCKRFGAIEFWRFIKSLWLSDNRMLSQRCKIVYSCKAVKWQLFRSLKWKLSEFSFFHRLVDEYNSVYELKALLIFLLTLLLVSSSSLAVLKQLVEFLVSSIVNF